MTCRRGWKSKPPIRKDSENMVVRKKGDMPFHRADSGNHPIDPCANLLRAFPAGTAVAEKHPPRRLQGIDSFTVTSLYLAKKSRLAFGCGQRPR